MTDPMELAGLIERLERAEAGSRELDCRIVAWSEGVIDGEHWSASDLEYALSDPDKTCNPDHVTISLDAALALAERVGWRVYSIDMSIIGRASVMLQSLDDRPGTDPETGAYMIGKDFSHGAARLPALALCIAILKAKAQGGGE